MKVPFYQNNQDNIVLTESYDDHLERDQSKVKELYIITEESKHNKTSSLLSDFNSAAMNMSSKQVKGNDTAGKQIIT